MSCFKAGDHNILLCVRNETTVRTPEQDNRLHREGNATFDVSRVTEFLTLNC